MTEDLQSKYGYYYRPCPFTSLDPYRIAWLYGLRDDALFQAFKKILVAGQRGVKDVEKDVDEAIGALQRWKGMREEESDVAESLQKFLKCTANGLQQNQTPMTPVKPSQNTKTYEAKNAASELPGRVIPPQQLNTVKTQILPDPPYPIQPLITDEVLDKSTMQIPAWNIGLTEINREDSVTIEAYCPRCNLQLKADPNGVEWCPGSGCGYHTQA